MMQMQYWFICLFVCLFVCFAESTVSSSDTKQVNSSVSVTAVHCSLKSLFFNDGIMGNVFKGY